MTQSNTTVWAQIRMPGFHAWPEPSAHRDYLGDRHRHMFHVQARVPVMHDDRDIEFHDLMDVMRAYWPENGEWGGCSCEMIAEAYAGMLIARFAVDWAEVDVSEDGEAGATVRLQQ